MSKQIVSHLWGVQYRTSTTKKPRLNLGNREYRYAALPAREFGSRWERFLAFVGLATIVLGLSAFPKIAFADPHAVFYTDRAQEQLFFNVLAALNQADYVEPPDQPPIRSDARLGQFIRTGQYIPDFRESERTARRNPDGTIQVSPPLESSEALSVELPRIRVRQVTSDDGDVYFRERMERRARSEELRVMLGYIACRAAAHVLGPDSAEKERYCPDSPLGVSAELSPFL